MTTTSPAPVFDHLLRMTDRRGTLEHSRLDEPLPEHGYCTDDVARVLVVTTREDAPDPDRTLNGLAGLSLRFLNEAQAPDRRLPQSDGHDRPLDRRAGPGGRLGAVRLGPWHRGRAQ